MKPLNMKNKTTVLAVLASLALIAPTVNAVEVSKGRGGKVEEQPGVTPAQERERVREKVQKGANSAEEKGVKVEVREREQDKDKERSAPVVKARGPHDVDASQKAAEVAGKVGRAEATEDTLTNEIARQKLEEKKAELKLKKQFESTFKKVEDVLKVTEKGVDGKVSIKSTNPSVNKFINELVDGIKGLEASQVDRLKEALVVIGEETLARGQSLEAAKEAIKKFTSDADIMAAIAKVPNNLPGKENMGKDMLANLMMLYHRNPTALEGQISKIKEYLKEGKDAQSVVDGLAVTAQLFANPFLAAIKSGSTVWEAHEIANNEMVKGLATKGLTLAELKELRDNCLAGTEGTWMPKL